jgi:hypothetical protein
MRLEDAPRPLTHYSPSAATHCGGSTGRCPRGVGVKVTPTPSRTMRLVDNHVDGPGLRVWGPFLNGLPSGRVSEPHLSDRPTALLIGSGATGFLQPCKLVRHFRRDLLEALEAARERHLAINAAEFDEHCPLLTLDASLDHTHVLGVKADDLHRDPHAGHGWTVLTTLASGLKRQAPGL